MDGTAAPDGEPAEARSVEDIAAPMIDRLVRAVAGGPMPCVVGLDGRSGSGKSTLAAHVASVLDRDHGVQVAVIGGDEFYAGGSASTWDARSVAEDVDQVMDWRHQHDVLVDLRDRGEASWRPFDWESPSWDAEVAPLADVPIAMSAEPVMILEGVYSCRPELADLLDLRVLLDPPAAVRRRQLLAREGDDYRADWEVRWGAAEDEYFGTVAPHGWFDLVLA